MIHHTDFAASETWRSRESKRWQIHHGDCLEWMRTLPDKSVDHVITDPPYSEHVHNAQRRRVMPDANTRPSRKVRTADLGFSHLSSDVRTRTASEMARLSRRWCLVFCDIEGASGWIDALQAAGLDYVRTGIWVKPNATPQFTGDRPAVGCEAIVIAHQRGKKRWNGGGKRAVWDTPTELNRGVLGVGRQHPTQKPTDLMVELVSLFTDPGETILDPFAGSGTTGVAVLRLGRSFMGAEKDAGHYATACERLAAEEVGSTLAAARAGQLSLIGGER